MSYLTLSNPTTDSCDFRVKLSNDFNTDYYRELKITGRDYGSSTSRVSSYVESRTARSSSSRYVEGVVNDGMSAGRTYTLYAYAQATNGTWYKAGSDTITMENGGGSSIFDLGIKEILYRYSDTSDDYMEVEDGMNFELGKEIKFKLPVKNFRNTDSPEYTVVLYDENGRKLDDDDEGSLSGRDTNNAYLYVTVNDPGEQRLQFAIETSGGSDTDDDDNVRHRTVTFGGESKECDLGITSILYKYSDISGDYVEVEDGTNFELDREVKFKVRVKNHKSTQSPEYNVLVYDENGKMLDSDDEPRASAGDTNSSYVYVTVNESGEQRLKFVVETISGVDTDTNDNVRYRTVTFGGIGGNDIFDSGYIDFIETIKNSQGVMTALNWMKSDLETYSKEGLNEIKRRYSSEFNKFTKKFNELLLKSDYLEYRFFPNESKVPPYGEYKYVMVDMEGFKYIHYLRNKLNNVPETLAKLVKEQHKWTMLPYSKAAFHMTGDEGLYNLKFVSAGDQRYEAVYDRSGKLITEEDNGYINMGTYNYIGPDNVSGHIACDVDPYYIYGNIEGSGKGKWEELDIAGDNIIRFIANVIVNSELADHYNEYAGKFGLDPVTKDSAPTHQPW